MAITHATVATGTDAGTGEIHKAEWNAAHIGSALSVSTPKMLATYGSTALNTQNPALTITALTTGQRIVVGANLVGRAPTSVTCTNVTFTNMAAVQNGAGSFYDIWVGVATGTSGTTLTVNTGSSNFASIVAAVVADTLTPTAGTVTSGSSISTTFNYLTRATRTAGRFVVGLVGADNTTTPIVLFPSIPASVYSKDGASTGTGLMLCYAPDGDIGGVATGATSAPFTVYVDIT